jgi:hypothetical protein
VSDVTAAAAIFTGAIGVGGTLVGGPILRALRWADWKTSFKDAANVSCGAGLLAAAYFHLAMRVDAWSPLRFIYGRGERSAWGATAVAVLCVMVGYAMLRRHGVLRSILSALLVIIAFVALGVFAIATLRR